MLTSPRPLLAPITVAGCLLLGARAVGQDALQPGIPKQDEAVLEHARQQRKEGKTDDAIATLRGLVASRPDYFQAQYTLGLALADKGDYAAAEGALEAAVKIKELKGIPDSTVYNSTGWLFLLAGNYKAAEEYLKKAEADLSKLPRESQGRVLNNLGLLYVYEGRYPEARQYLTRAATEFKSAPAHKNLKLLATVEKRNTPSKPPRTTATPAAN